MDRIRASSSPELLPPNNDLIHQDESPLGGAAANVKLLLKLIQDETDPSKDEDGRRAQRTAGMLTILDDIRSRVERSQSARRAGPTLLRCNTDIRRGGNGGGGGGTPPRTAADENQKLRRELSASMTARKSLEKMFSGLGKEKEIIAAELARKVREISELEELVEDLRAQNETLTEKVRACAAAHGGGGGGDVALQERNRALSEQLLKALDGYRSAKRRLKEAREEIASLKQSEAAQGEGDY